MSGADMSQQAQQLWSMLDEMAANNPQGYRSFIDKHLKEGREAMRPPQPHMCVRTTLTDSTAGSTTEALCINVMSWQTVTAPKNSEAPIPVMGGTIYKSTHGQSPCKVVSIAFHPSVLDEYGVECTHPEQRHMLINLALDYICDQYKVTLSRNYKCLDNDTKYIGSLSQAQQSLTQKYHKQNGAFEDELGELESTLGPMAAGCKDSLLREMANITMENQPETNSFPSHTPTSKTVTELKLPSDSNKTPKSGLIEEISDCDGNEPRGEEKEPSFELSTKEGEEDRPGRLVVKIHLPDVESVAQCQLSISGSDVELVVPGLYRLSLPLPRPVQEQDARAKFSRRSSTLTLTLPLISPAS